MYILLSLNLLVGVFNSSSVLMGSSSQKTMTEPSMSKIFDSHLHFWDLDKRKTYYHRNPSFEWPNNSTPGINNNFLPAEHKSNHFYDSVFVQALNQCTEEIEWVQELAATSAPYIKGIVGGLDLTQPDKILEEIKKYRKGKCPLVGIRHILDADPDPMGFFEKQSVLKSLELINEHVSEMTMDLLVRPYNLHLVSTLASRFPSIKFIIDHIAKPQMSSDGLSATHEKWMVEMKKSAQYSNVYVKISGLITEVDNVYRDTAPLRIIRPFTDFILSTFGVKKCIFGSDWPVSINSNLSYKDAIQLADNLFEHLTTLEKDDVFFNNGIKFYGISNV